MASSKMFNLARAFGERACRQLVSGGYDAIYSTVKFIKTDEQARAFKKACLALIWRNQARVSTKVAQSTGVNTSPIVKSVGMAWLVSLLNNVKGMSLATVQKASGHKKEAVTTVSFTSATLISIRAKRAAVWHVIKAFEGFGLQADMGFSKTRNVVFNIANAVSSAKDIMVAAGSAVQSWILAN